jgi:hypothetical protein
MKRLKHIKGISDFQLKISQGETSIMGKFSARKGVVGAVVAISTFTAYHAANVSAKAAPEEKGPVINGTYGPAVSISKANAAAVTVFSAPCGRAIILAATGGVAKFEGWSTAVVGKPALSIPVIWQGEGVKSLQTWGCTSGEEGRTFEIRAVGISGKFPITVQGKENGGGGTPTSPTGPKLPAMP